MNQKAHKKNLDQLLDNMNPALILKSDLKYMLDEKLKF